MPRIYCPHCNTDFELAAQALEGQVVCPNCGKPVERLWEQDTVIGGFEEESAAEQKEEYAPVKEGDVLSGFRIEERIGAGAMAVVYKATQLSLGRPVALKILPRKFADIDLFVEQFESETDALASLNHPNIVSIIDRGRQGDTYFFAMEYVEGTTLAEIMRAGRLNREFFIKIMMQTADALRYAHARGIVHRDIKLANIMLNDQGNVKVADFGLAALIAESQEPKTKKSTVMGTPDYMSPEQRLDASAVDERSDLYSLGVAMYETLTGSLPSGVPPVPPSKINKAVDPTLDGIVLTCLKQDRADRYQTAAELLEVLQSYQHQLTRIGEVCPKCKKQNPETEKRCLHCGADLSELFDICPECGTENRRDVEICRGCGANLETLRERMSVRISKIQDRARDLVEAKKYTEAIEELKEILQVKGKLFEHARSRARELIQQYAREHKQYHRQNFERGRKLAKEGKLDEALRLWRGLPAGLFEDIDVATLVRQAQATLELCKQRAAKARELIEKREYEGAEKLLSRVRKVWQACPGLQEGESDLQAARQLEDMVAYELGQADEHLQKRNYQEAREVLKFALQSVPDHPAVKAKLKEISQRERREKSPAILRRAKEAYDKGRYTEAASYWRDAAELFDEGDEQRKRLLNTARRIAQRAEETGWIQGVRGAFYAHMNLWVAIAIIGFFILMTLAVVLYFT